MIGFFLPDLLLTLIVTFLVFFLVGTFLKRVRGHSGAALIRPEEKRFTFLKHIIRSKIKECINSIFLLHDGDDVGVVYLYM